MVSSNCFTIFRGLPNQAIKAPHGISGNKPNEFIREKLTITINVFAVDKLY